MTPDGLVTLPWTTLGLVGVTLFVFGLICGFVLLSMVKTSDS